MTPYDIELDIGGLKARIDLKDLGEALPRQCENASVTHKVINNKTPARSTRYLLL